MAGKISFKNKSKLYYSFWGKLDLNHFIKGFFS